VVLASWQLVGYLSNVGVVRRWRDERERRILDNIANLERCARMITQRFFSQWGILEFGQREGQSYRQLYGKIVQRHTLY
jgi:hypothetical protein